VKESLHKSEYRTIPTKLSEEEFNKYVLPHLSMPKRGPRCKIGYLKVYNYIARVDYTGEQWKMLPIDVGLDGKPEIHYTQIYRYFARWSDDGSFERAFIASVEYLAKEGRLDLSVLNGDGTNTIAKKGAILSAIRGISTKKERRYWQL
jgi:transposase